MKKKGGHYLNYMLLRYADLDEGSTIALTLVRI